MDKFTIGEKVKVIVGDIPPVGSNVYIKEIYTNGYYKIMWESTFGSLYYKMHENELE